MSETPIGGAASAGAIKATIDFDAAGLQTAVDKAMRKATGRIEDSIDRSMENVQDTMRSGFRKAGATIVGFLGLEDIAGGVRNALGWVHRLGQETEAALNNFRAVSGATADQMERVSDVSKELGNDISLPGTSAADAAMAMTELAKAGFTVEESMEAAKGTLQLATAAQIDAGTAAEISSKQIQAFGLEVSDAGMVADILANAANATSADMQGMADSLNQVGAVASASGLSFAETSAAVALMADNAIVGSDAGTSLKSMLLALQAPSGIAAKLMSELGISAYDSSGRMLSLAEITAELTEGTKGLTDQEKQHAIATIFGADAVRTVNVLMNQGADEVASMTEQLQTQGAAAKLAAANSKGLVGALGALQSTAESLAIEIYQEVAPAIDKWLRGRLDALPDTIEEITQYLGNMADGLDPVVSLIGAFVSAASPGAVDAFRAAMAALLGVVQAVGFVLQPLASLVESNEDAFRAIVGTLTTAYITYRLLSGAVNQARTAMASPQWVAAQTNVKKTMATMKSARAITAGFQSAATGMISALGGPWGLALAGASIAVGMFAAQQASAKAQVAALTDTLDEQTGAFTENTRETLQRQLVEDNGWDTDRLEQYGLTLNEITDAVLSGGDAFDDLSDKILDAEAGFLGFAGSDLELDVPFRSDSSEDYITALRDLSDGLAEGTKNTQLLADAQSESKRTTLEGADALRYMLDPASLVERSQAGMKEKVEVTNSALDGQKRAADGARRALAGLNNEAIEGIGGQIGFEEASDNLRKTINQLNPEVRKNGRALDLNYAAGRQVYQAFIDLATSADGVKGGMSRAREQIFDTIRPMVNSKAEARRLTDQFFDLKNAAQQVPDNVRTHVEVTGIQSAMLSLSRLRSLIAQTNNTHVRNIPVGTGPNQFKGNAGGGAVYGPGTGTSDDILRRLSDGEHVFRAEEVRAAGGQDGIYAMRAALRRGGLPAVAEMAGGGGALVDSLAISVGSKDDLPEAFAEAMFHLRRIKRGSRYV